MRGFVGIALSLALLAGAGTASADPWKDESGHGREWKQEYQDGHCKVEGGRGEYKEEIKCDGPHIRERRRRHEPRTVYVEPRLPDRVIIDVPLGR